jgi:hypothetical protein
VDQGPHDWLMGIAGWLGLVPTRSTPRRFRLSFGALEILDEQENVVWKGRPDGRNVERVFQVPGGTGAIVLLDADEYPGRIHNLLRVDLDGQIVWRAQLPSNHRIDAYVAAKLTRSGIVANSSSSYRVVIDPTSGEITSLET